MSFVSTTHRSTRGSHLGDSGRRGVSGNRGPSTASSLPGHCPFTAYSTANMLPFTWWGSYAAVLLALLCATILLPQLRHTLYFLHYHDGHTLQNHERRPPSSRLGSNLGLTRDTLFSDTDRWTSSDFGVFYGFLEQLTAAARL